MINPKVGKELTIEKKMATPVISSKVQLLNLLIGKEIYFYDAKVFKLGTSNLRVFMIQKFGNEYETTLLCLVNLFFLM